jgi:hypothetical protein
MIQKLKGKITALIVEKIIRSVVGRIYEQVPKNVTAINGQNLREWIKETFFK